MHVLVHEWGREDSVPVRRPPATSECWPECRNITYVNVRKCVPCSSMVTRHVVVEGVIPHLIRRPDLSPTHSILAALVPVVASPAWSARLA